ncbi:peroxiredoxin [Chondrinema litorale]|uniref:peroxiredoxin n=1 Tax=Chondrinema litorale TaxID=2994555 RepID=UPI0025432B2A|nr:peroxiredoxin [Chondrinema litorale]UZR94337.1 peroxiredoxin [Chondrinema litorale]
MALANQTKAPDFTLPSTSGEDFSLYNDMSGKPCIIYFYPKDFTRGCTKEACSFRDTHEEFKGLDIEIFGISKDSIETHLKFKKEYQLPFDLLSDKSGDVCKKYKALIPVIGIPKRITYLLDKDHKIVASFDNMFDFNGHIKEMIKQVKS